MYTGYEVKMPQTPLDVLIIRALNKFLVRVDCKASIEWACIKLLWTLLVRKHLFLSASYTLSNIIA